MKVGDTIKELISKSIRRRHMKNTQEIVVKTYMGKHLGRPWYTSETRHESI